MYEEVFLIIDALDECNEELRWGLVDKLETLRPKLHLLITSRYLESIDEELINFKKYEFKAHRADIELFIDHQIRKNKNLRRIVERSPSLRTDIKEGVVKTAENMFLLARLHVESLASAAALSVKHVRTKLQRLPTTLTATYDDAMLRIQNQEPDRERLAFKTLAWVSYAFRSLSLRELQHALAIEPGDTELDEELMIDGQSITALCAGLVVVDQGTNQVTLVHCSTKHYFAEIRHVRFPYFHASITLSCATYLTLKALVNASIWDMVQKFPLACYAAQYMGDHARQNPEDALEPSILETICQLLSHPDKRKPLLALLDGLDLIRSGFYSSSMPASRIRSMSGTYESMEGEIGSLFETNLSIAEKLSLADLENPFVDSGDVSVKDRSSSVSTMTKVDTESSTQSGAIEFEHSVLEIDSWETKIRASRIPEVTALHLAASMGLAKVASMLLKQTPNIDAVDETGKTALAVAIERGFEKAVEFLVNSGACVDLRLHHGQAVLLLVTERNWNDVGEIIVQRAHSTIGEENSPIVQDQLRFLIGVYNNSGKEVQLLVDDCKLDLKDRDLSIGQMALFLAVERERLEMVQRILAAGVDINSKDNTGRTSLHRATRRENETLMKLLLQRHAVVDSKDDEGRTAWSAHARSQNTRILGVLLQAGADPSTTSLQGVSPLYTAAQNGEIELVKFLLDSGTDPSIQTEYDWAPLHWAASYGHVECVKLLIQAGADLSPISDQNVTPLDLAIRANQVAIIDILQQAGAKQRQHLEISSSLATLKVLDQEDGWVDVATLSAGPEGTSFTSKVMLVFDKPLARTLKDNMMVGQFIYPPRSTKPVEYVYEISHVLETLASSIIIKRASLNDTMSKIRTRWHNIANQESTLEADYFASGDSLYEIISIRQDYQEFELRGRHQTSFLGAISMLRDWTGGWKIRHDHEDTHDSLFRTTPDWTKTQEEECRWMSEDGILLARTGWEDATLSLCFEHGSTRQMQDVLVSCWIAKL